MLLPRILLAAIVAAPLAWSPVHVSAQERGLSRAENSTAQAVAVGLTYDHAQNRPTYVPKGISKAFGAAATLLPPGVSLRFHAPVDEYVDEDVDEEECEGWTFKTFDDGTWGAEDCDGNRVF